MKLLRPLKILLFLNLAFAVASPAPRGNIGRPYTNVEPLVMRSIRDIHRAQMIYQANQGNGNFGTLQQLSQAGLIDSQIASGLKYGYNYQIFQANGGSTWPATFTVAAYPWKYRKHGVRSYFMNQNGELHGGDKNGQSANVNDPIIDVCTSGSPQENELCTLFDLRMLISAEMTYASINNGTFGSFPQLYLTGLIRSDLHDYNARGYVYSYQYTAPDDSTPATFKIVATPQTYPTSAVRSFYIDQTGIIRGADKNGAPANENDPPVKF